MGINTETGPLDAEKGLFFFFFFFFIFPIIQEVFDKSNFLWRSEQKVKPAPKPSRKIHCDRSNFVAASGSGYHCCLLLLFGHISTIILSYVM